MADQKTIAATGNYFVAEAFRQADPDVVTVYPITPQTTIMEEYAKFVANGRVHSEYVTVESEHSSMSAAVGSSAAGARTVTSTSSQGLAYMWEVLHIASGLRLPIVMANANRALAAPINIHCDHSDIMGARDTGWVILFAETAQEAYDNTLMSFRIAEHPDVMLPAITALDGFITTHSIDRGELLDDEIAKKFVGEYKPEHPLLDVENPVMYGGFSNIGGSYQELKEAQHNAMKNASKIIPEIGAEFEKISGRSFGMVEGWGMEDAERAIVVIGSTAGNARHVARQLRAQGEKVGVVKIRCFRPFPARELVEMLDGVKAVAVLDRSDSYGAQCAPLGFEVRAALYDNHCDIPVRNYIYGLGGADVRLGLMRQAFEDLKDLVSDPTNVPDLSFLE